MSDESTESTLILPGETVPSPASLLEKMPPVVWLRNPKTGVINRFRHGTPAQSLDNDTIERCLKDGHTPSSEAAARAQAIELAKLQGRPLPPWADDGAQDTAATAAPSKTVKG